MRLTNYIFFYLFPELSLILPEKTKTIILTICQAHKLHQNECKGFIGLLQQTHNNIILLHFQFNTSQSSKYSLVVHRQTKLARIINI